MKYILKESKLDNIVKRYLDFNYNLKEIHFTHTEFNQEGDYVGEIEDTGEYYFGDYGDDDIFARKYGYEYFNPRKGEPEDFPKLDLEIHVENDMNTTFNHKHIWEKPFIEWFNEKTGDNIKSLF
jgi:hypothetical protein